MSTREDMETIVQQKAAGTLFNTYTTAKSVINAQAKITIPANYLQVGDILRVTVQGALSNKVTTQSTFTFNVMMGSVIAWTSGAVLTNADAHELIPFDLTANLRVDSIGSGTDATLLGMGTLTGIMFLVSGTSGDSALGTASLCVPATAPAVGTGFDSTIDNVLDFHVAIENSDAADGIQIYNYIVEILKIDQTSLIE